MKRALMLLAMLSVLLVTGACDQAEKKEEPAPPQPAAQQAIADSDIAVPADFEEETAKAITASNYKSELDKIEGDMQK